MINKILLYLKHFDWILFASVMLLICFGLIELYSIALGQGSMDLANFNKQIFFVIASIFALFIIAFFDYNNLRSFNYYFYAFGVLLLVGVLIFGKEIRGTKAWFDFGGVSLQPVEFVKFILIIFLARYFSSKTLKLKPLKHLLLSGIGSLVFIVLVLLQPDFGSALVLFLLWALMIVISGFKMRYILIIGLIIAIAFSGGWFILFKDYQKERVLIFFNPAKDSLNTGYNIAQATIAVGAGGLTGRGVGFGSQSQLKFLPEAQNDFIFAVIAEELGFIGVFLIATFFLVLFYRILKAIKNAPNDFGIYFLLGAGALIFIEMFINIGMNIGLLPVIGISLPFLSYGGSAILSSLMLIGVAQSIIIRSKLKY